MTNLQPTSRIQKSLSAGRSRLLSGLADNPTLAMTLVYLLVSGIGLAYSWRLLSSFGINILYYADIQDFLVAAVRRPVSIGLFIVAFGLMTLAVQIDLWLRKTVRWYNLLYKSRRVETVSYNPWLILGLITITSSLYVFSAADREARHIREGDGEVVEVVLREGFTGSASEETGAVGSSIEAGAGPVERILVASTSRYIFLYDRLGERLEIVPFDNLAVLRPLGGDPAPADTAQAGDAAQTGDTAPPDSSPPDTAKAGNP